MNNKPLDTRQNVVVLSVFLLELAKQQRQAVF